LGRLPSIRPSSTCPHRACGPCQPSHSLSRASALAGGTHLSDRPHTRHPSLCYWAPPAGTFLYLKPVSNRIRRALSPLPRARLRRPSSTTHAYFSGWLDLIPCAAGRLHWNRAQRLPRMPRPTDRSDSVRLGSPKPPWRYKPSPPLRPWLLVLRRTRTPWGTQPWNLSPPGESAAAAFHHPSRRWRALEDLVLSEKLRGITWSTYDSTTRAIGDRWGRNRSPLTSGIRKFVWHRGRAPGHHSVGKKPIQSTRLVLLYVYLGPICIWRSGTADCILTGVLRRACGAAPPCVWSGERRRLWTVDFSLGGHNLARSASRRSCNLSR
jgi:hypothetical protein